MLFHYVVEGTSVKDSSKVPPDVSRYSVDVFATRRHFTLCEIYEFTLTSFDESLLHRR